MPINPSIAMGFQQPQIDSPLNAMARATQIQQAQEEMQLNALRAKGMERELAEADKWSNALRSGVDFESPEGQRTLLAANPAKAIDLLKNVAERKKAAAEALRIESETTDRVLGTYRSVLPGIQTPEQMAEWYTRQFEDARLANSPVRAHSLEQKIASIPRDPAKFAEFKAQVEMGMDKYLTYKATSERGIPLLPGSKLVRPTAYGDTTPPITEPRQQGPQMGTTESTPGQPRQAYRISSDPDGKLRVEVAPIPGTEKPPGALTEKDKLKLKKEIANDYTALNSIVDSSNDTVSLINQLETHPGLKGITGFSGMLPSIPEGNAAAAEGIEKSLKGKVTQLGKQIADSSGKIGPMALGEWKIVSDMVTSLDRTKGKDIYLSQLQDIKDALTKLTARNAERFSGLYEDQLSEFPQFSEPRTFNLNYQSTSAQRAAEKQAPAAPKPAAPKETSGRNMSSGPKVGTVADGYRFKGGDPSKKENWEKQ